MVRFSLTRLWRPLQIAAAVLVTGVLLAWLMGAFGARVEPGPPRLPSPLAAGTAVHTVAMQRVPQFESAVGTIRAVHETAVSSRILGRIRTLTIERAGQQVEQGAVIAELDSPDLMAGVERVRAALAAATTRRDKARIDLDRTTELVQTGVTAPDRLDTDRAAFLAADAEVEQARQVLAGAESQLAFATVTAPIGGIIVDKKVNVGDVVQPGQLICTLYDPTRLQLVAVVREQLAGVLEIGREVDVVLDALGKHCQGTVAEIVPAAESRSRSFEVKVVGPCQPGIVTGMFGRLQVPIGERDVLQVPRSAVASVGQLDFVHVVDDDRRPVRRYVRTGPVDGDRVEILSGLAAGERIVLSAKGS